MSYNNYQKSVSNSLTKREVETVIAVLIVAETSTREEERKTQAWVIVFNCFFLQIT